METFLMLAMIFQQSALPTADKLFSFPKFAINFN